MAPENTLKTTGLDPGGHQFPVFPSAPPCPAPRTPCLNGYLEKVTQLSQCKSVQRLPKGLCAEFMLDHLSLS